MIIGSALLLGLFVFPLWNIQLEAPQYPDPLGMDIYIGGIQGEEEFDIQNIDAVNHYIGMKKIPTPSEMWEFNIFPIVIGIMAALGILVGILGYLKKDGISLIPINIYFSNKGLAKLLFGLGKGKKKYDNRQSIKEKDWNIKKTRMLKNN